MHNTRDMPNLTWDMTDPFEHLMPSADVCHELNDMDRSTLSRWVAIHKITPVIKLPGRRGAMLFNRDDVAKLKAELDAEKAKKAAQKAQAAA